MKLIPVKYYGFTAMDKRFSSPMLPWIISEIRKRDNYEKLSLGIEDGNLQAYDADFEIQFTHRIPMMTRFSQADVDPSTFLYLLREEQESLLYCFLYQAASPVDVSDLYQQMKDEIPTRSVSSAAKLTSLCVDISPSSSHFFEVLYIGKIKVSHKKVPDSFIDDALEKFKVHNMEKSRIKPIGSIGKLKSENDIAGRRGSQDSVISESGSFDGRLQRQISDPELKPPDLDEHNRTMVLQVGRSDLRLISPDRKLVLLHKQHTDIATCIQGIEDSDHFGFICKEGNNLNTFIGYVFKCESASVASDAVNAISQAFINAETRALRREISSCEHCPMVWFHKLCVEVEHMSDRKTQAAIFRKIDMLDDEEQSTVLTKFRGAETDSIREQNEFLMMLLRAHCEMKQGRHTHDTAENRSEFLNQYLGGSTIFMKAKRSLSNSFDHLLKRKASKDDFSPGFTLPIASTTVNRETSPNVDVAESDGVRSRSSTMSSSQGDLLAISRDGTAKQISPERGTPKSPMMDIFLKVGNSPRSNCSDDGSPQPDRGSWRQAIFNRVTTPSKPLEQRKRRSRAELRELWRNSIHQAILLVRMEKENARLRARQEESAVKRIKLEYDEMLTSHRELVELWDLILNREAARGKCDNQRLFHACRQGIPRSKRGEAWWLLAEQHCLTTAPLDTGSFPLYGVPYDSLLKQLTSHQHAILIDLGRTFPAHAYYSSPLGPGQLALFNLLKAYSLLDSHVGYCQGLSFVAGVLLLHVDEQKAFILLRHLMFRRGLRGLYLPDMAALQLRLYQLARLLHDQLPDLYQHLDLYEVAPTLYAAPWILTMFASQFPLGFVTRVFDIVFLEGPNVVLHICVILLTLHGDSLLACDSFEEIMDYLKVKLPAIDQNTLEAVMKQVFAKDISRQLDEYEVEYHVLQDEVARVQPQVEALHKLERHNRTLTERNKTVEAQLEAALSNVQRLERMRTLQQSSLNRLEVQARGLQVTVNTLGLFISDLVDRKVDVEIPGEVRRIIAHIAPPPPMVKSLSVGRISLCSDLSCEPLKPVAEDATTRNATGRPLKTALSNPNIGTKMSNFFSNSHSHILQQKFNKSTSKTEMSLKPFIEANETERFDETENEAPPKAVKGDVDADTNKIVGEKPSPTDSVDSGVGTPAEPHPLSNCDVNFTFNGTSQLKNIKSFRTLSTTSLSDNQ